MKSIINRLLSITLAAITFALPRCEEPKPDISDEEIKRVLQGANGSAREPDYYLVDGVTATKAQFDAALISSRGRVGTCWRDPEKKVQDVCAGG